MKYLVGNLIDWTRQNSSTKKLSKAPHQWSALQQRPSIIRWRTFCILYKNPIDFHSNSIHNHILEVMANYSGKCYCQWFYIKIWMEKPPIRNKPTAVFFVCFPVKFLCCTNEITDLLSNVSTTNSNFIHIC